MAAVYSIQACVAEVPKLPRGRDSTPEPVTRVDIISPPCTPRITKRQQRDPSPPLAPRVARKPPLMKALERRSALVVRECLAKDPQVATQSFCDHEWEPPLCTAIRCGCGADIVELLLQHGARVDAVDVFGRTPLAILATKPLVDWARARGAQPAIDSIPLRFAKKDPWTAAAAFPTSFAWPGVSLQQNVTYASVDLEEAKADSISVAGMLIRFGAEWQHKRSELALSAVDAGNGHLAQFYSKLVRMQEEHHRIQDAEYARQSGSA